MKTLTKITLLGAATLAFSGCSSSHNSTTDGAIQTSTRAVSFLTDADNKSLYTFDKDVLNKSNCLPGKCQDTWPLFVGVDSGDADLKVLADTEGHLAYRKHPLYYFVKDTVPGAINGNGVKGVWHLAHAPASPVDTQVKSSSATVDQTFLTDKDQRTLYTFDNDSAGVSNCYGGCEDKWPVFYSADLGTLPAGTTAEDFATISRDASRAKDGEPVEQITYKGKPLYYFTPDNKEALSAKGDWAKGVWHVVELNPSKSTN